MSDDSLTPADVAVLLALMAEARELSNKQLNELCGFTLDGAQRRKLNNLKLVETASKQVGTSKRKVFVHELTDSGWARCRNELSAGRPSTARGTANGALYAILAGLGRFIDRKNIALADVFLPAAAQPPAPARERPAEPAASADGGNGGNGLEARVRSAYSQLARRPGELVRLSALRQLLGEAAKSEVDKVLKQLDRSRVATVLPEENQKTLTADDREAAVKIGGKDNHLIKIENA